MRAAHPLGLALGLFLLILAIGLLQPIGLFAPIDEFLMRAARWLHGIRGAGLVTHIAIWLDRLGSAGGRAMIALAIGMSLASSGRPDLMIRLFLAAMGTSVLNSLIKLAFDAPRPSMFPSIVETVGTSFPSGHSAGAMALYGALALMTRSRLLALACIGMILCTGMSRVWLGVHWPSDVFAGWLAGAAWLLVLLYRPRAIGSAPTAGKTGRKARVSHGAPVDRV